MIKLAKELHEKIEKGINGLEISEVIKHNSALISYYNIVSRDHIIESIISDAVDSNDTTLNDELKREIDSNALGFRDIIYRAKKLLKGLQSGDISLLDYEDLDGEIDAVGFIDDVKAEIESITENYEFELSEYNNLIKRLNTLRAEKETIKNK